MNRLLIVILSVGIVVAFWSYLQYSNQLAKTESFVAETKSIADIFGRYDLAANKSLGRFATETTFEGQGEQKSAVECVLNDDNESYAAWNPQLKFPNSIGDSPSKSNSKKNASDDASPALVAGEIEFAKSDATLGELGALMQRLRQSESQLPLDEILLRAPGSHASGDERWNCRVFGTIFVEPDALPKTVR